jgi:DnaK suppressor protein
MVFLLNPGRDMKIGSSAKRVSPTVSAAKSVMGKPKVKKLSQGKKYAAIRRDLERQRKAMLEEAVEGLANPNGQEAFPDVSDQASAEAEQNFLMRIREREQRLIKKIDEALARLDQNIYGICERCEEEIPYPRLKARPVTTLCINCKTLEEQEEKTRR